MTFRKRYGMRRYLASFWQHNGSRDPLNQPTYSTATDWEPVISGWPCELIATNGGEVLRGRQVTAETTHVLFGEFFGAAGVKAQHRCQIDGTFYNVVAAYDADGTRMEQRIEVKAEVE